MTKKYVVVGEKEFGDSGVYGPSNEIYSADSESNAKRLAEENGLSKILNVFELGAI